MAELLLLRYQTEDAARSPELRYLASTCLAEARRVFGTVDEVLWRPGTPLPELPAATPVLVFGKDNTYLSAASLRRMHSAIGAGADVAVPIQLASFALAEEEQVQTLRGFERLERRLLDEGHTPRERRRSQLPVALMSPTLAAAAAAQRPPALLTDPTLLTELGLDDSVVHAGISFQFGDYYGEVRDDVLPLLPPGARDVLEIGCGRGGTGRLFQQQLGCRVTGVELNPEVAREAAEHLHRVIVGDVETLALDGRFDAVVATELFEHLNYPEAFLLKMKPLLRPGGRIVLSVPNVGHYSIVEDLLAGRWDYVPMGLLCYTHFRFFTRATLADWLERTGFPSYKIIPQTTALPERFADVSKELETDRESLRTSGFYVVVEV